MESGEVCSFVTYITHVNLGLNFPQFLQKIVEEGQPMVIAHLNSFILAGNKPSTKEDKKTTV